MIKQILCNNLFLLISVGLGVVHCSIDFQLKLSHNNFHISNFFNVKGKHLCFIYNTSQSSELKVKEAMKELAQSIMRTNAPLHFQKSVVNAKDHSSYFLFYDTLISPLSSYLSQTAFETPHTYWIFITSRELKEITNELNNFTIPFHSEVLIMSNKENDVVLTEIYKQGNDSHLNVGTLKEWNPDIGWGKPEPASWMRRNNFGGVEMIVIAIEDKPFFYTDDTGNYCGFLFDVWKELERELNFRSKFIYKNTVNLASINMSEYDVLLSLFTALQVEGGDLSYPLHHKMHKLYYRTSRLSFGRAYKKPFRKYLLYSCCGVLIFATALLTCTLKVLKIFCKDNGALYYQTENEISDSTLLIISATFQQSVDTKPKSQSVALIILFTFLFTTLLYTAYTGYLTSYIAIHKSQMKIKNLTDLIRDKKQLLVVNQSSSYFLLKESKDLQLQRVYRYLLNNSKNKIIDHTNNISTYMTDENVFLFSSDEVINKLDDSTICAIESIKAFPRRETASIVFSEDFQYRKLFNFRFNKMDHMGLLSRLRRKNLARIKDCKASLFTPFGLDDINYVTYWFLCGLASSIVVLLMEILIHKFIPL